MRLKMDARTRRLLRRLPVVNAYSVAELALLAALGVQCARLVWTVATPVTPLGDWRPAQPAVAGAPIDILTGFDPFFRLDAPTGPASVTTLQLTLFGTRTNDATGRGSAIVAGPDGIQQSVAVGDEIVPGARLKAVAFDHVTIDRGGKDEDLFLDQSGAVTPTVPGGSADAGGSGGIAQLRRDIGFIPRLDGGRVSGLVVRAQGPGTLFRAAGLRDGDVVTSIGGRPVSGPQDIDRVASDFAGGGTIPVTVERGSTTLPISIAIPPPAGPASSIPPSPIPK